MIKIVAKFVVKDECIDRFKELASELVEKSAKEDGNAFYTLNQSTKAANEFAFIECWKDKESTDKHGASEHFTRIFPQLKECNEGDLSIDSFVEIFS